MIYFIVNYEKSVVSFSENFDPDRRILACIARSEDNIPLNIETPNSVNA